MTKKDSFIIYRSFYIGLQALKSKDRLQLYDAIFEYGLNSTEIDLKPLPKAMFLMIKPQLQANHRKFLNGQKGGQATKDLWAKQGQVEGQNKSKAMANVNVNNNDNKNVKCYILLPLKDGKNIMLDNNFMTELEKTYPLKNINEELQKMRTWLFANPTKQKTARGTPRFVSNWLSQHKDPDPKPTDSYADIHKAVMDRKNVRK